MADPTDEDSQSAEDDSPRGLRKKIEEANARTREAEERASRLEGLQRENAVLKAKLDGLNEKQLKALFAAHEGDVDAESLAATAAELGFGRPNGAEAPAPPAQEDTGVGAMEQFTAAGSSVAPPANRMAALNEQVEKAQTKAQIFDIIGKHPEEFGWG